MTIPIGKKVKLSTVKYARVGKLMSIDGDTAEVEYKVRGYGRGFETETHPVTELVQVCKETVFRDYASNECGRPVKEGDLCGIHVGAIKRAQKLREKHAEESRVAQEKRTRQAEIYGDASKRLAKINEVWPFGSSPISIERGTETPLVTVTLNRLEELIAEYKYAATGEDA